MVSFGVGLVFTILIVQNNARKHPGKTLTARHPTDPNVLVFHDTTCEY